MVDVLDPDTLRAQRMAELADIAEFRKRRLVAIQEWSENPEKRFLRQREIELGAEAARALVAASPEKFSWLYDAADKVAIGVLGPIKLPVQPKPTALMRILNFIGIK